MGAHHKVLKGGFKFGSDMISNGDCTLWVIIFAVRSFGFTLNGNAFPGVSLLSENVVISIYICILGLKIHFGLKNNNVFQKVTFGPLQYHFTSLMALYLCLGRGLPSVK